MNPDQLNAMQAWLNKTYDQQRDAQIKLLRAYTNDVYLINSGDRQSILKCYGVTWRTEPEIHYEVALIEHLVKRGLPTANVIRGKDGQAIYKLKTDKGEQFAVLFEYAAGEKPQPPFSLDLYVAFGQAIAQMHSLSDDFVTGYARKPLDLVAILHAPLELTLPLVDADTRSFLLATAKTVTQKLNDLIPQGLDWGPIHGDATLDNLHVTADNEIVLYDFDSGGLGWRAADLQGWAYNNADYAARWEAFKQGYASVRELKAVDLEAAPYLAVAWLIWGLEIDLGQRILAQGEAKVVEYLAAQMAAIREQANLAFN
ncbi:MAG: phosphotransferase [Chloroflexi bacterium]|nr:phosphotransferase [Chloroflexota bacterium]MCC6896099.1 phosphotransferase [Anaerolineae bacterium]